MKNQKIEMDTVVDAVEGTMKTIESEADKVSKSLRRTLIRRFPVVAVLVVAFGVTATATGAQFLYMKLDFFVNHPGILLILGLVALIVMGKLHQKLG